MMKVILLTTALVFSSAALTACSHKATAKECGSGSTECPMAKDAKGGHDCQGCKHDHDAHHDGKHDDKHDHEDKSGH